MEKKQKLFIEDLVTELIEYDLPRILLSTIQREFINELKENNFTYRDYLRGGEIENIIKEVCEKITGFEY